MTTLSKAEWEKRRAEYNRQKEIADQKILFDSMRNIKATTESVRHSTQLHLRNAKRIDLLEEFEDDNGQRVYRVLHNGCTDFANDENAFAHLQEDRKLNLLPTMKPELLMLEIMLQLAKNDDNNEEEDDND